MHPDEERPRASGGCHHRGNVSDPYGTVLWPPGLQPDLLGAGIRQHETRQGVRRLRGRAELFSLVLALGCARTARVRTGVPEIRFEPARRWHVLPKWRLAFGKDLRA